MIGYTPDLAAGGRRFRDQSKRARRRGRRRVSCARADRSRMPRMREDRIAAKTRRTRQRQKCSRIRKSTGETNPNGAAGLANTTRANEGTRHAAKSKRTRAVAKPYEPETRRNPGDSAGRGGVRWRSFGSPRSAGRSARCTGAGSRPAAAGERQALLTSARRAVIYRMRDIVVPRQEA